MQMSDDFPMMPEVEAGMDPRQCPPVLVAFGMYPIVDAKQTANAGHDVYKDVEFIRIAVAGDRNSLFFQPATDVYRKRFPQAYAAFKQREKNPMVGMPIEQWAPINRALAFTLKAANVDTVEALAAVHDGNVDRIGGNGRELRAKAIAWLDAAKSGAATAQLAKEKQVLQDQIAALQAQIVAIQQNMGPQKEGTAPIVPQAQRDPTADVEKDVIAAVRRPMAQASA